MRNWRTTAGVFPLSKRTRDTARIMLCDKPLSTLTHHFRDQCATYLPNEIFRKVAEVVRPRNVRMREQVLIWVLGFVTIPEEQLEEMEETDPVQLGYGTLQTV